MSHAVYVVCSVPQGSVLGPHLFIMYMEDLEDVISEHGINMHAYADDSQLYLHSRHDDVTTTVCSLEQCITEVGL